MESNHPRGGGCPALPVLKCGLLGAVRPVCRDFASGGSRSAGSDLPSWGHRSGHGLRIRELALCSGTSVPDGVLAAPLSGVPDRLFQYPLSVRIGQIGRCNREPRERCGTLKTERLLPVRLPQPKIRRPSVGTHDLPVPPRGHLKARQTAAPMKMADVARVNAVSGRCPNRRRS